MNGSNWLQKIIESEKIINDRLNSANVNTSGGTIVDGVIAIFKIIISVLSALGEQGELIFVVVAICGFFLIMAGIKDMGNKLVGGSVLSFLFCKACGVICLD